MSRRGRPPKGEDYVERISVGYRFAPETVKVLKKAARKAKMNQTQYVEGAILERATKDGVDLPVVVRTGAGKPKFGTGRGRIKIHDPNWWKPMTDKEVDAFLEGRY